MTDRPSLTVGETVLVVGAERQPAASLAAALRARGLGVLEPQEPVEALALASAARPDVVLLDPGLPGLRSLCRRLRDDPRCGGPALAVLVPPGVTPFPTALWGDGVEPLCWNPVEPAAAADRVLAAARRQRGLRSASPLTGLPGNEAIRCELERRLRRGEPVALLHADLDGFKAYNDRYGFLRGDQVIRTLGDLLAAATRHSSGSFVGHVGGDDFVVLLPPAEAEDAAWRAVAAFDAIVQHLYDPGDAGRGWIVERDRLGRRRRWPLLSLSIGMARSDQRPVPDALVLVDRATEMKRVAKRMRGSTVAVDRRQGNPGGPRLRDRALALVGTFQRVAAVTALVVAAALVFVPAGSALAAARPGDTLYPAARLVQEVRLAIAASDTALELRLRLAGDRLADAVVSFGSGDEGRAIASLSEFRRHNESAARSLVTLDVASRRLSVQHLVDARARHAALLSGLIETRCGPAGAAGTETCVALRAALDEVVPSAPSTWIRQRSDAGAGPPPDNLPAAGDAPATRAPEPASQTRPRADSDVTDLPGERLPASTPPQAGAPPEGAATPGAGGAAPSPTGEAARPPAAGAAPDPPVAPPSAAEPAPPESAPPASGAPVVPSQPDPSPTDPPAGGGGGTSPGDDASAGAGTNSGDPGTSGGPQAGGGMPQGGGPPGLNGHRPGAADQRGRGLGPPGDVPSGDERGRSGTASPPAEEGGGSAGGGS